MIIEFGKLIGVSFPRKTDEQLAQYLRQINVVGYDLKMLEKDFYLTGLLAYISNTLKELSFKGGTCLNKVYFPYFRLSEDLDFSMAINDPIVDSNSKREQFAGKMRGVMKYIASILGRGINPDHVQHKKAQGNKYIRHKEYTYLKYELSYISLFATGTEIETIKIECTYTHKQLLPSQAGMIQSIYQDLIYETPIFSPTRIQCLDISEMIAEKTRAALTRRIPAIRDFYDLGYFSKQGYILSDYLDMIREKCEDVDKRWTIIEFTKNELTIQTKHYLDHILEKELHPVLLETTFDLDTTYKDILHIYHLLNEGFQIPIHHISTYG